MRRSVNVENKENVSDQETNALLKAIFSFWFFGGGLFIFRYFLFYDALIATMGLIAAFTVGLYLILSAATLGVEESHE